MCESLKKSELDSKDHPQQKPIEKWRVKNQWTRLAGVNESWLKDDQTSQGNFYKVKSISSQCSSSRASRSQKRDQTANNLIKSQIRIRRAENPVFANQLSLPETTPRVIGALIEGVGGSKGAIVLLCAANAARRALLAPSKEKHRGEAGGKWERDICYEVNRASPNDEAPIFRFCGYSPVSGSLLATRWPISARIRFRGAIQMNPRLDISNLPTSPTNLRVSNLGISSLTITILHILNHNISKSNTWNPLEKFQESPRCSRSRISRSQISNIKSSIYQNSIILSTKKELRRTMVLY